MSGVASQGNRSIFEDRSPEKLSETYLKKGS
jgi:hypothetical protein